jgi:hypothetical protein
MGGKRGKTGQEKDYLSDNFNSGQLSFWVFGISIKFPGFPRQLTQGKRKVQEQGLKKPLTAHHDSEKDHPPE